jgi:hypothetical protein
LWPIRSTVHDFVWSDRDIYWKKKSRQDSRCLGPDSNQDIPNKSKPGQAPTLLLILRKIIKSIKYENMPNINIKN